MKIINVFKIVIVIFLFMACGKIEDLPKLAKRTIVVYMAADNDLSYTAFENLQQMEQEFMEVGTNIIVFFDQKNATPCLAEIQQGKDIIVKSYPELNSASSSVLKSVIQDIIDLYPAKEYGLILWSHGSSWMPNGVRLRSFGEDSGLCMNIPDLAESLPVKFDFILFDACLMGSIEVVYELKDKANYIIASSTETIYQGFPYDMIIPELIRPKIDFNSIARSYFNYYNNQSHSYKSATISVVDTRYLSDLAFRLKKMLESNNVNLLSFDRRNVQRLDLYPEQYVFDFQDFVEKILPNANKNDFIKQLSKVVQCKYHTAEFVNKYYINSYCGLSCYIPIPERSDLNTYYQQLKWYKDAGLSHLLRI